jgi:D-beta-D-heptose 7-phosphate kinase/D-beta-D-heptose 1-phosphate adenosyltransferase
MPGMSTRLIELVEKMPGHRVALVGDFMLDRYIFGRTERISPEGPIPILRFSREEQRLGGAGFVHAGLAALGAKVNAVGVIGNDPNGNELRDRLRESGANVDGLVVCRNRPTVTKTRLLGSSEDKTPQQMIRLDIEESGPCDADTSAHVIERGIAAMNDDVELLCLEDYNKGVLTADVCAQLIARARSKNIPVFVDPARLSASEYQKYRGATVLKLNRPETERATGISTRGPEKTAGLKSAAEKLLSDLQLEAVVITLNDGGAYLALRDGTRELLASRPRQVADATGAGDMVLVALCIARAAGAAWHDAVQLANVAGGLEVERLGCVPITPAEIIHDLMSERHDEAGKERTRDSLLAELAMHRAAGRKVVFTNGCFDIIHLGHVKYFQWAKSQGDLLVVGVNTDSSIRRLKGEKRPVIAEDDRVGVLEELESIDYIVRFDDDTPLDLIRAVRPDVLVKGEDYTKEQVIGWDLVESCGGRIALAPLVDGRSTSAVIQKILEAYGK